MTAQNGRKHLVLVPGFVGFDALGQLRYYAGVAQEFQRWRAAGGAGNTTLHYFDNFPTASVAQRADRLHSFLAEKVALGEIGTADEVTLLGHSTGGLDIRALLARFRAKLNEPAPRNDAPTAVKQHTAGKPLANSDLRPLIRRVVFMSVPHYGTNIADFAARYQQTIQDAINDVIHALGINRRLSTWFGSSADVLQRNPSDLVVALADVLVETDGVAEHAPDPAAKRAQVAAEREARSELLLWLEHMQDDFGALLDLRSLTPKILEQLTPDDPISPAHYDATLRAQELADFAGQLAGMPDIHTLSFVTHAAPHPLSRVFAPLLEAVGPLWTAPAYKLVGLLAHVLDFFVLPRAGLDVSFAGVALTALTHEPKLLYALMHRVCSHPSGPFTQASSVGAARASSPSWSALLGPQGIGASTNDGVVNTLSMLYPYDAEAPDPRHQLAFERSDHADIIGQYARVAPSTPLPSGRSLAGYDIFPSQSQFREADFQRIWKRVFDFSF